MWGGHTPAAAQQRPQAKRRRNKSKLSVQEQLALSGILLLDDRQQSDFLSNAHYVQACREMKLKYGQFADAEDLSMHDVYKCVELIQNGDSSKVKDLLGSSHLSIRLKTILFSWNRTYGASYSIKGANENTIIKDYLLPILDPFFPNTEYSTSFAREKGRLLYCSQCYEIYAFEFGSQIMQTATQICN
ncbi:hypothetical protein G6F42_016256 [Rhizopus arrhizus]|nr:hypothetical protein G6F42_016256 [Rhizopus arrhizus]